MNKLTPQEQWIADCALGYLRYDDANPDVGMGMFYETAIDYAFEDAKKAAMLFAGGDEFMLLNVNRKNIEDYVITARERR